MLLSKAMYKLGTFQATIDQGKAFEHVPPDTSDSRTSCSFADCGE